MEQPTITFIINGATYSLSASNAEAIRNIPKTDRQQLMTLLEAVKHQEILSLAAVQKAVDSARLPSRSALKADEAGSPVNYSNTKPERLGSGDVDALMARLIQEEKRNQKPGLTQWSIYKVVAGLAAVLILIVLIV